MNQRWGVLDAPGTPESPRNSTRSPKVCHSPRRRGVSDGKRRCSGQEGVVHTPRTPRIAWRREHRRPGPRPCVGAQWCAAPSRPGSAAALARPRAPAASPATRSARCRTPRPGPGSAARWRGDQPRGVQGSEPSRPEAASRTGRPAPLRPGSGAAGDTWPACVCVGSGRIGKDREGSGRLREAHSCHISAPRRGRGRGEGERAGGVSTGHRAQGPESQRWPACCRARSVAGLTSPGQEGQVRGQVRVR